MYTGYKTPVVNNSFMAKTLASMRGSKHETEVETLQREVDNYTRKMEQEKRKYFGIQQSHKNTLKDLEEHQQKLKEIKRVSCSSQSAHLNVKIKNLENSLEQTINNYDDNLAHNNKLKTQIDRLRREKKNTMETQVVLETSIKQLEGEISSQEEERQNKRRKNLDLKNTISQISCQNELDKSTHQHKLETLQIAYGQQKAEREGQKLGCNTQKAESIDTHSVLKMRLKKIISKNSDKVKFIDQYQKHLKTIQEAFGRIKSVTGLSCLQQITNTFIKAEEQNASLYSYLITLSQNIDNIHQYNKEKTVQISRLQQQRDNIQQHMNIPTADQIKNQQLKKLIESKRQNIDKLNNIIQKVEHPLGKLLKVLRDKRLFVTDYTEEDIGGEITLDDRNIELYLSKIDRFVNQVVQEKHCQLKAGKGVLEPYIKDESKTPLAPVVDEKEDKEFFLYTDQDFKKFAEEYIERKKGTKQQRD